MASFSDFLLSLPVFSVLSGAAILYAAFRFRSSPLRALPLPPGPSVTSWLSGHFSIIPSTQPAKVYAQWAEIYGPIIHLRVYGQRTIILSSIDDCTEVFEKRSNLYSDRPVLTMINLMGWDFNTAFMPYGRRWRWHRRFLQQTFRKVTSLSYRPEQTRKVNDMLYGLLTSPDDFRDHVRTVTAATVMSITYGYDIKPKKDYFVDLAEDAVSRLSLAVFPGAALVNALPFLQHLPPWLPGAGFHKIASESRPMTMQMKEVPFKWVQKNIETGTQSSCLISRYLPSCKTDDDLVNLQEASALVYAAAAETTTAAIEVFFHAMTIHPSVQRRAQQELNAVVGNGRLPNYDDWDSLPYTEALMREVLRWRPIAPLGIAHATTDDDVFKGYLIPKGTLVMANIWAISRDESRYIDPETFDPDRFFDKDGTLNDDDCNYVFGFGRRICPGRHMARATLWLSVATTLWAFNIAKAMDGSGNKIPVEEVEYTDGVVSHPHSYACSITPRSPQTRKIVEEAVVQTKARSL